MDLAVAVSDLLHGDNQASKTALVKVEEAIESLHLGRYTIAIVQLHLVNMSSPLTLASIY